MKKTLPLCLLMLASLPAAAQMTWYAGAAGGRARTDIEAVRNRESTLTLVQSVQTAFDDTDTAWKAFAGLKFNSVIGLELAYADLGRATTRSEGLGGSPAAPFSTTINRNVTGFGLDLVGF